MTVTVQQICEDRQKERTKQLTPRSEDGLILAVLKITARVLLWASLLRPVQRLVLYSRGLCSRKTFDSLEQGRMWCKYAVEIYCLLWFVILWLSYGWMFHKGSDESSYMPAVGVILSSYRVVEILAIIVQLHSDPKGYRTSTPIRALLLNILIYFQNIVAFGTFFLAAAYWSDDSFAELDQACIQSDFWHSLYFSFVTVTTLGYGDFSPTTVRGKILVVLAVTMGFIILIVALQRVLAASSRNGIRMHSQSRARGGWKLETFRRNRVVHDSSARVAKPHVA